MTELEQPPQNGIDPTAGEDDDNNKARPADIEQDMREMERRKRVEAIMGSRLFREELERIVDSAREGGAGASGILQQLSDIVGVPVSRATNVFKSSSCMVPINDIRGVESMGYAKGEKILRCKLAATFRLLDLYGWTQGLGAQITARLKVDQEYFLVNPYGLLYHEITASSLNKVDMQGQIVEQGTTNFGVNKSHFVLHSVVHAARPDIRCAIYIGCSPVVAISSLKSGLLALTKDACVLGEISTHSYTGLFDEEERNRLVRSLGPNSKVMLLTNHGALCCGETIEEAFFAACNIVKACETQLKLLPVGVDNLVLIPEESRKLIYDQSRRPPEDLEKKFAAVTADEDAAAANKEEAPPKIGSPPKWRVGGAEFEALMRMLDNAGYRTGYIYRHPLIKSDPPKPKNDVELPPAVSSLGYLLEEEELFRQGIWKKGDLRKGGDRSRWLNSPNVYQKVEVLETGTPDPKKITKWVAEGSPTHSTPVRIEDPLQFVPAGTTTKEFKRVQQKIKDNRRADLISAGPQSHILEGVTWDEANRIKDATVSQTGDHVVLMGAASKGIIQRGFQHNATVYKAPYAKNPFDNVTDDELNEYKRTVERKKKSIHGEYTDTDFSESEALNSMQAAGAHAHTKHAQSEPETEHQVIQIQTQQAPIPSQAEVVLSDAQVQDQGDIIYDEVVDKENQNKMPSSSSSTSKCRRDLSSAFVNANLSNPTTQTISTSSRPDLTQRLESLAAPGNFYTYAYSGGDLSLGRCCQPQICSILLQAIHSEYLPSLHSYNRSSPTSSTMTSNTNESSLPIRSLHLTNVVPVYAPYRTCSHFGFNSPRQPPRAEHRHMPGGSECIRYRPMQRVISYEEIFASPRYEHLCQTCFEKLLRLKPELQRRPSSRPSFADPDELVSYPSSSVTPRQLTTLAETNDEEEEEYREIPSALCHVSTQTGSSFLRQLERLNFSEESTNVNYVPGLQMSDISLPGVHTSSSPAASATSEPPLKALPENLYQTKSTITDITEVWNFGNWQQESQQEQKEQQPLTERHITLEITQQFNSSQEQDKDPNSERQLMSRDERHRRKTEFQELWQDHVDYFGAKKEMEEDEATPTLLGQSKINENSNDTVQDKTQAKESQINCQDSVNENKQSHIASGELPKMLHEFEQILSAAGDNLEKLVATAKKLQADGSKEASAIDEIFETGSLFRTISLENIADADDGASVLEPQSLQIFTDDERDQEQELEEDSEPHVNIDYEEKRDDEKPVTPPHNPTCKEKDHQECSETDEKDIDEIEVHKEMEKEEIEPKNSEQGNVASVSDSNGVFSPLEREILDRIEADKLKERESIFGRIDECIRNKFMSCRLKNVVTDVEETFSSCTHIFRSPPAKATPHLFQFRSEPRPSSYSMHNIDAPSSSSAHAHLITGQAPRLSRSFTSYQNSSERSPSQSQSTSSLESIVSSKTFVCRSTPRQKRNFIQENIRNASKPRAFPLAKSTKNNRMQEVSNDASSICTFQVDEERGKSARFWVTLPTSSHKAIGQKRRSQSPGRQLYPTSHSSCSPYAKRRKPIVHHMPKMGRFPHSVSMLRKSISSRTFFSQNYNLTDSAGLVQVESITTFELKEETHNETQQLDDQAGEDQVNNTNSTLYYSGNESTLTEAQETSQEMDRDDNEETQDRLSGGETAGEASMEEEIGNETTVEDYTEYTSYTDGNSQHSQSTNGDDDVDANENNHENQEDNNLEIEEISDIPVEAQHEVTVDAEESDNQNKTDKPKNATDYNEDNTTSTSSNDGQIVPYSDHNIQTSSLNESDIEDEQNVDRILEVNSSSTFSLSSVPAAFNLGSHNNKTPNFVDYESDSSVDKEVLLAKGKNLYISDHDIDKDEDDNEPNTSAAAAKKRRSKSSGNQVTSKESETEDVDVIVLGTQCKLKKGTLHVTEDPLEDIQAPRDIVRPNHFRDDDIFEILEDEFFEEIASSDEEYAVEAFADESFVDEAAADEASADEASADEPSANEATANETSADKVEFIEHELEYGNMDISVERDSDNENNVILNVSFNESETLRVELERGRPSSFLVVPSNTFNLGPFFIEFKINFDESTDKDISLDDEHSMQSLEISQNEANQSMALQEEIQTNTSDNLGLGKMTTEESKD